MSKNTEADMTQLSAGQQRKLEKKKEIAKEKRDKLVGNIVWYAFIGILAVAVLGGVGYFIYRQCTKVVMNNNYSACLDNKGFVENVKASDIVNLGNYKGIQVPYEEIKMSDEDLDKKIETILDNHKTMSETTDKEIAKDDVINLDYVGSVDGVEFDGGSTKGEGTQITVGSANYVDNFEEQLIGHKVKDEFTIEVTFPADYGKEGTDQAKLNGKKAQFAIKINSIQIRPEFTDEFVKENFADDAETAEEYRAFLRNETERASLEEYVMTDLYKNTTVSKYPKDYIKALKSQIKYSDYTVFYQYATLYAQYGMSSWSSFADYIQQCYGQTEAQYDVAIVENARLQALQLLAIQAIAEKEGISGNAEAYKTYLVEQGEDATTIEQYKVTYGEPYFVQQHLAMLVADFVADAAVVTGK